MEGLNKAVYLNVDVQRSKKGKEKAVRGTPSGVLGTSQTSMHLSVSTRVTNVSFRA